MQSEKENILNSVIENSEGYIFSDKDFALPTHLDFMSDNFSVELHDKIKNTNVDVPLYLETPFTTTPGYYDSEKVFIVKAIPFIEEIVSKKYSGYVKSAQYKNIDAAKLAKSHEELFSDDGDTVYFMNDSVNSGNSSFTLGNRNYEDFKEFLNIQENVHGKFGVRFLGIDTPEIPHYSSMPMNESDIVKFKYGEIKDKTNFTVRHYKTSGLAVADRDENDEISFFFDKNSGHYYEIAEKHFAAGYDILTQDELSALKNANAFIAKIVYIDSSRKNTVSKGIEMAKTVRELIGKCEDICIMLDQQTLSRESNYSDTYTIDYFSSSYSIGNTPWNTIENYWKRFFSDARYKFLGFNAWGQDNNKRMLGTIYLKVIIPEISKEPVWINLTKYILQKYPDDTKALPDYTSDPMQEMHNGFVSSAFKLWTYDFKNQIVLDALTSYTNEHIEERNKMFENLLGMSIDDIKEYSMIIGDNAFIVPPTSIRCITQTKAERVQMLRSRGSAVKQAPTSEKLIELKLYFNSEEGINGTALDVLLPSKKKATYYMNGLRALIAQFKLTPFLPIENNYINEVLKINAVTLMDLQVSTMQGFPKCIQATLTLQEFNYYIYMPELPMPVINTEEDLKINVFSKAINYPVMRWYYQRLLQKGNELSNKDFSAPEYIKETFGSNTALVPMDFENSGIEFYLPDKKWLDRRKQVFLEQESKPIRPYYPITENGKEFIRQTAPMFNGLMMNMISKEAKDLSKQIIGDFLVDYSADKNYPGHTLYDVNTDSPIKNSDGTIKIHNTYLFKLTAIQDNFFSEDFMNYDLITNFNKITFGYNEDTKHAEVINAAGDKSWKNAKTFGFKNSSSLIKKYFQSFNPALAKFGPMLIKENLVKTSNEMGKMEFIVQIPLAQVMTEEFEREEFKKLILTKLGLKSNDDIFSYNQAGALCVKIKFFIPAIVKSITYNKKYEVKPGSDILRKKDIFIANGDIQLDENAPGFQFIKYCDRSVKQIVDEKGNIVSLDFVGDDNTNMTDEVTNHYTNNYIESENSFKFEKYDIGEDINIQAISCIYSNSLARISLNAMDGYAHQFCGGQDSVIEVSLTTKNKGVAGLLQTLPRLAASYVIDYKEILPYWPLRIKSEITKLFGINEVLIESVNIGTVPNFPGIYSVNIRMISVDRSTRNKETLKRLDGINNSGSTANTSKNEYIQKSYFDLQNVLGKAEIYPDLELPTINELEYAGYKLIKYYSPLETTRTFVDPDFYFIYGHALTHEIFKSTIEKGFKDISQDIDLTDKYGSLYTISESEDKDGKTNAYKVSKTNQISDIIEENCKQAVASKNLMSVQEAMNKKAFNELDKKNKISSRLTSSIAGLKTPIWSISDKLKFPFREDHYKTIYKEDYKNEPDQIYKETIKANETRAINLIEKELSSPIDLKRVGLDIKTIKNFPTSVLISADKTRDWAESRIKTFSKSYNKEDGGFIKELCPGAVDYNEAFLANVLIAYADYASGFANNESKMIAFIPDAIETEEDKRSGSNWKLNMFLSYGKSITTGPAISQEIDLNKFQPYCKINSGQQMFASTIEEGIALGKSFGPFQIQMYPKKSIIHLIANKAEKDEILKSEYEYFFLDPYYRKLQLSGDNEEELKQYKEALLLDPAYGAYAYLRNLMVWYEYLINKELVISMYECIKKDMAIYYQESSKDIKSVFPIFTNMMKAAINSIVDNDNTNIISEKKEDELEEETNAVYEEVFDMHAKVFATSYCSIINQKEEAEKLLLPEALEEAGIPKELHPYIKKRKKSTDKDVKKLIQALIKLQEEINNDKKSSPKEKEIEITNVNYMLAALGHKDGETYSVSEEDVLRYGYDITNQFLVAKENSRVNNQTFKEIYSQLAEGSEYIMGGKLIGLSMLLMRNSEKLLHYMSNMDVGALDSIMLTLTTPDKTGDNAFFRKYLMALDGRNVLALEYAGKTTQTAEEMIRLASMQRIEIKRSNDIREYLRDSYLDMIVNDKRGRMLRAFPTYYMLFIDEGREIGLWKLHDNFYNMNAISEITVTKSRKIAADTAEITMSNMFKTFSTDDTQRDYDVSEINSIRYNMRDAFTSIFSPRVYAMKEEQRRLAQEIKRTTQLQPGIRMNLRMGYGANAATLPVLFNGNIAEVGTSDIVDIVAQGDGHELLNPITDIDDASDVDNKELFFIEKWVNNWMTNGATPKQILTSLLHARGTWLQDIIRKFSNGRFYSRNPYGITHFGDVDFKDIFSLGEITQNIFEANPRATYGEHEKFSGLEANYNTEETPVISIHLLGKTFWDVMHICASAQPDYITSIAPFGMRSSIFYGSPRYYYAYDYTRETLENGTTLIKEKRKPFQQKHIYTSFSDIIHNNITASAKNIKTNAIGLYQERRLFGDKVKQVGPLFVDFDIYPEFQKSTTVDTQLWAKGMPVVGNAFGIVSSLSKNVSDEGAIPIPGAKEIAWRMTASALKNSIKDMYTGEITVIGDASVKPYDRMSISDVYERMDGECEVEAVVHSLNVATGFTTSIYADCVSVIDDEYEKYANMFNGKIVSYAVASMVTSCVGYFFGKSGAPFISSMLNLSSKPTATAASIVRGIGSFLGEDDVKIADALIRQNDRLRALTNTESESIFISVFNNDLKSKSKKLSKFTKLDPLQTIQADEYLKNLADTLNELDNNSITNEMAKKIKSNGKDKDLAQEALKEYQELLSSKKADLSKLLQTDEDLMKAVFKLYNNEAIDEASKKTLMAFRSNPNYLSNADNVKEFRKALVACEQLGDDALDVAKSMKTLMSKSDDIVKVAISLSDDILLKGSIKSLFTVSGALLKSTFLPALVLQVLEMGVSLVVGAFASEFIYRYLQNLEVLNIFPLKKKGRAMVAGIDGHKGMVVGSPTEKQQGEWTNFMISLFDGEKGSILKYAVNSFLVNEDIATVAKRLRRDNDLPEPYGTIDSVITQEKVRQRLSKDIKDIYANNSYYNSREIMRAERIPNLSPAYDDYKNDSIIRAEYSYSPKNTDLSLYTIPIQEDEELKAYFNTGFLDIFNGNIEPMAVAFNGGKSVKLDCYKIEDGRWIVPTLRHEAMILLKDCINILFKMSKITNFNTESIENPYVFITSATIIGGKSEWENTGYAFRLGLDANRFSNKDIDQFCLEIKDLYVSLGILNFMECTPIYSSNSVAFCVKPTI